MPYQRAGSERGSGGGHGLDLDQPAILEQIGDDHRQGRLTAVQHLQPHRTVLQGVRAVGEVGGDLDQIVQSLIG